jgi:hypothetical protein
MKIDVLSNCHLKVYINLYFQQQYIIASAFLHLNHLCILSSISSWTCYVKMINFVICNSLTIVKVDNLIKYYCILGFFPSSLSHSVLYHFSYVPLTFCFSYFSGKVFFFFDSILLTFLPGLTSNWDPPNLCLLIIWGYICEPLCLAFFFFSFLHCFIICLWYSYIYAN